MDTQLVRDIHGGPRRFTEVVLDEQSLPVTSLKSRSSEDGTSATRANTPLAVTVAVATRALMAPRTPGFST